MTMADDDNNFFSRWSRRKVQVRSGEPLPPEAPVVQAPAPVVPAPVVAAVAPTPAPVVEEPPKEQPPALTLEDVARLTPESDYSAFVARGVPSDVRNAAVKKLFTDPHYNVMDGLDIYIDDYSKPSPLSVAEMAKMVGAQFLKLVDDPEDKPEAVARADGELPPDPEVAGSTVESVSESRDTVASDSDSHKPHDDHADLQLQPDDALEPKGSGRGAG